ncbi:C-3 sterol dehydrogenase/C-4 decarboxylase-like protein [Clohesyomyces aquaticus]|uniref:C-3 sterol dehydrogenase/C-4 decarboxylase-like protein n=1 Tax=Clohesyomyces aquaticus TaxID=1231657 RepID=A0A1Y1Y5N9_9PLEO|nr:C-3 sterol dehydrogenase/C-4 decarboxylase-like protein [Clohesyomyces aquaticus]
MEKSGLLGTVLVTGGCGWLGAYIVEALLAESECTKVVVPMEDLPGKQRQLPGVAYHICDITKAEEVKTLLDLTNPKVIIHTVSPGFRAAYEASYRINYVATKQFLDLARQHSSVQGFVYCSPVEGTVLKSGLNTEPEKEEDSILETLGSGPTPYARTKGATDALVRATNDANGTKGKDATSKLLTTVLRISGLYGPRDKMTIPELLKGVKTIGTRVQIGKNDRLHDWILIQSAARGFVQVSKALIDSPRRPREMRVDGEAFSITDGSPMRVWDFTRTIWKAAGDRNWNSTDPTVIQIPMSIWMLLVSVVEWVFWLFTFGAIRPPVGKEHFVYMKDGCRSYYILNVCKALVRVYLNALSRPLRGKGLEMGF